MPQDLISENPSLYSTDTASFFRGFIAGQDEVSPKWNPAKTMADPSVFWVNTPKLIHQIQVSDSNLMRTSVFTGHQLEPKTHGPLKRDFPHQDWIFGLLLLCTTLLLIAKILNARRLGQIFSAFARPRQLTLLIREGNLLSERVTPPLIILHMLSFSLFFYQIIRSQISLPPFLQHEYTFYLMILGGYVVVFGARLLLITTIGWIFDSKETTNTYIINSVVIDEVWGMMLIPVCLMVYYAPPPSGNYTVMIASVLFAILLLFKLIRNFLVGLSNPKFSWLYLFLYLCTVEILPVLFLGKMASEWLSV